MSFYINDEQALLRDSVRQFVEREVRPLTEKMDREDYFPAELFPMMGELGFLDLNVDEEYGGSGIDLTGHCIVIEEISKASATLGMCLIAHIGLATTVINALGTPEQKKKWLEPLVTGKAIGAYCTTEPCGNGNVAGQVTKAVKDGDSWVINGTKCLCTNIGAADYYFVKAITGEPGQISFFLVEKGTPGFEVSGIEDKVGWRGSDTGSLSFDNVRVPEENLIGPLHRGAAIHPKGFSLTFYNEMTACGACALGIMEEANSITLDYLRNRMHAEGMCFPMKYDVMRVRMMECQALENAVRSMTYSVSKAFDDEEPEFVNAMLIKPYCFDAAEKATSTYMNLLGGAGVSRDMAIERLWRDAKVGLIGGGQYDMLMSTAGEMRIAGLF